MDQFDPTWFQIDILHKYNNFMLSFITFNSSALTKKTFLHKKSGSRPIFSEISGDFSEISEPRSQSQSHTRPKSRSRINHVSIPTNENLILDMSALVSGLDPGDCFKLIDC